MCNCEEKVADQKLPEFRDQKIIDVVKLKILLHVDIRSVSPPNTHNTNFVDSKHQALPDVTNCTIEVGA